MRKAALLLLSTGTVTAFCGMAGLDGPTPVGCGIVALVGIAVILIGIILAGVAELQARELAKELKEQKRRKAEFFKVWKACRLAK